MSALEGEVVLSYYRLGELSEYTTHQHKQERLMATYFFKYSSASRF
jgi:hypothetical protein